MKNSSNSLYKLINDLAPVEKRYFKKFAHRHVIGKVNNYYELYELIESNVLSSDKITVDLLNDTSSAKYFAVAKKQLFDYLLEALHQYESASSLIEEIKSALHKISILFNRGFINEGKSLIRKHLKKAEKYELFSLMHELIQLKKQWIAKTYYNNVEMDDLIDLHSDDEKIRDLIKSENDYWLLFSRIYKIHFTELRSRKTEDERALNQLFETPLLKNAENARTFKCRLDFYQLNALRHFLKRESAQAAAYNKKFIEEFDKMPHMMDLYPERYLAVYNNYLIDQYMNGENSSLRKGLETLFDLPSLPSFKKVNGIGLQVFRLGEQIRFNLGIREKAFEENVSRIQEVNEKLTSYGSAIAEQNKVTFYYLFAYSCFGTADFEACTAWINKIIDETDENSLVEIQLSARLINLLAHYELGNEELLYYTINNLRRYHSRRQRLFKFEKIILSALNRLIGKLPADRKKILHKLKRDLHTLKHNPNENRVMGNFDWESWIDGKLD